MTESRVLKLLLIEDDLDDQAFLREALVEIEERRQWCNWRSTSVVPVEQLADALDCLRQEWFDAILMNLSLPDSPVLLDSFLEVASRVNGTPILVLADEEDENLANRLLREGAQDVLLKSEMECAPLARALRYAIERQRRADALQSSAGMDILTGTLTHAGFLTAGEHYRQLSRHSRLKLILSVVEIVDSRGKAPRDRDRRDLLLIQAAELLRNKFPAPSMIGRLDRGCFSLITAGLTETSVEKSLSQVVLHIEGLAEGGPKQTVKVFYSLAELYSEDNLEELLSDADPALSRKRCEV